MAQTAMVNFRMDAALKANMERTCKAMGMSMSTAFTIFATKVSREKRIPFEIDADPFFGEANQAALAESIAQLEAGQTVNKSLDELVQMEQ